MLDKLAKLNEAASVVQMERDKAIRNKEETKQIVETLKGGMNEMGQRFFRFHSILNSF